MHYVSWFQFVSAFITISLSHVTALSSVEYQRPSSASLVNVHDSTMWLMGSCQLSALLCSCVWLLMVLQHSVAWLAMMWPESEEIDSVGSVISLHASRQWGYCCRYFSEQPTLDWIIEVTGTTDVAFTDDLMLKQVIWCARQFHICVLQMSANFY